MRIIGIDPGTRRCGVAITDSAQTLAFPREAISNDESLLDELARLIEEETVGGIVVGRPVALSGNVTASTKLAHAIFETILERFPTMPVEEWDERLTTLEAQRSLSGAGMKARDFRGHIDSAAAVIMLQNYIDAQRAD